MTEEREFTPDDVRETLHKAARLRAPKRHSQGKDNPTPLSAHIEALEDYLLLTAYARGELEEARLYMHEARDLLRDEWTKLTGWEMHLGGSARNATKDQVIEAKRKARPDLYDGMEVARELIDRLTDQIRRLIQDDAATSRAYTLATGS